MKSRDYNMKKGFTLIELLMVIAIIGILAGILIPTVGAVRKQANIAASKTQISQYVTAIEMFKGEYGYYPFVGNGEDTKVDLSSRSAEFIETLSGRDPTSGEKVSTNGNRRQIGFHSFSESEFEIDESGDVSEDQLADWFNNTNIKIMIDGDGDKRVSPDPGSSELDAPDEVRSPVTAWVESNDEGDPAYALWE